MGRHSRDTGVGSLVWAEGRALEHTFDTTRGWRGCSHDPRLRSPSESALSTQSLSRCGASLDHRDPNIFQFLGGAIS